MPFIRISASLTIEEKDASEVTEVLLTSIDSLIVKRIPVFDSDLCSNPTDGVSNAEEIRHEIQSEK
jgi:hypothetical protein